LIRHGREKPDQRAYKEGTASSKKGNQNERNDRGPTDDEKGEPQQIVQVVSGEWGGFR